MVAITLTKITTITSILILIIAAYTTIQPLAKISALRPAADAPDNQTLKNATHIVDNKMANINNTAQLRRSDNAGSKLEPSDISTGDISAATLSNPQMVINLLSSMTPDEISTFPLKDIPNDELLIVLNGLSVQNLFKTLENIPAGDLADIFNNKIPQDKSQGVLNRLTPDQSQEISDRLTAELTK